MILDNKMIRLSFLALKRVRGRSWRKESLTEWACPWFPTWWRSHLPGIHSTDLENCRSQRLKREVKHWYDSKMCSWKGLFQLAVKQRLAKISPPIPSHRCHLLSSPPWWSNISTPLHCNDESVCPSAPLLHWAGEQLHGNHLVINTFARECQPKWQVVAKSRRHACAWKHHKVNDQSKWSKRCTNQLFSACVRFFSGHIKNVRTCWEKKLTIAYRNCKCEFDVAAQAQTHKFVL